MQIAIINGQAEMVEIIEKKQFTTIVKDSKGKYHVLKNSELQSLNQTANSRRIIS